VYDFGDIDASRIIYAIVSPEHLIGRDIIVAAKFSIRRVKALRLILADTALVKNLDSPEYVQILLDGCHTLQERFAKIDSHLVAEQLKAERKKQERIRPEMKKMIQLPDLSERLTLLLAGQHY